MPQLLEKAATISGGISSSSIGSIAYHFRTGLDIQIEETEIRQLAENLHLLLADNIHAEGQVGEVPKTRGVDAEGWEPSEAYAI